MACDDEPPAPDRTDAHASGTAPATSEVPGLPDAAADGRAANPRQQTDFDKRFHAHLARRARTIFVWRWQHSALRAGVAAVWRRVFPGARARRTPKQILAHDPAYHERADRAAASAARPPEGEEIGLRCVWVVEVYLASQVAALERGLRALGLDARPAFRDNPLDELREGRATAGGSWQQNVGLLERNTGAHPGWLRALGRTPAALPPGVDRVALNAIHSVPSATVLVAQFAFDDATARGVEAALGAPYATAVLPRDGSFQIAESWHRRAEAVRDARTALRLQCVRWMRERLPGAFAESAPEHAAPTCELLTFAVADPLHGRTPPSAGVLEVVGGHPTGDPVHDGHDAVHDAGAVPAETSPGHPSAGQATAAPASSPSADAAGRDDDAEEARVPKFLRPSYLKILEQEHVHGAWACEELPGLTLREPRDRWERPRSNHLILSARVRDGGRSLARPRVPDRTPDDVVTDAGYLAPTLAVFALDRLTARAQVEIAMLRDRLGDVPLRRPRRAVAHLQRLERDLARFGHDLRPLLTNIAALPDWVWPLERYTFVPLEPDSWLAKDYFAHTTAATIERARGIVAAEAEVRSTAQSTSALLVAATNLRLARINLALQVTAIAIAVLGLLLAALALPQIRDRLRAHLAPVDSSAVSGAGPGHLARPPARGLTAVPPGTTGV